jgi:hypothetical protein
MYVLGAVGRYSKANSQNQPKALASSAWIFLRATFCCPRLTDF